MHQIYIGLLTFSFAYLHCLLFLVILGIRQEAKKSFADELNKTFKNVKCFICHEMLRKIWGL